MQNHCDIVWCTTWSIKLVNVGFLKHSTVSVFFTGPFFTTIWGILFICANHQTSKSKYFCLALEYFWAFLEEIRELSWCERSYKTTFLSAFAYFQGATFVLGSFLRHNFPQLFWWKKQIGKGRTGPRHQRVRDAEVWAAGLSRIYCFGQGVWGPLELIKGWKGWKGSSSLRMEGIPRSLGFNIFTYFLVCLLKSIPKIYLILI